MAYEAILYDVADCICTITLNRPEKLNAWTHQMHLDLKHAMHEAGRDPDVRAIILTGAGRGFCAGQDLSERKVDSGPLDLGSNIETYYNPLIRRLTRGRSYRPLDQGRKQPARRQHPG